MLKYFLQIRLLTLVNLFAFLAIGVILGALFGNRELYIVLCLVLSIIPLGIILYIKMKSSFNELNNINKNNDKSTSRK